MLSLRVQHLWVGPAHTPPAPHPLTSWGSNQRLGHLTTAQGMTKSMGAPAGRGQLWSGGPGQPAPHRAGLLTPADA
ncbi:unnamed protein product, partial [Gulo gulo]